ncbi:MAG: type II toxin-antitoxin system VapC family toxin [Chloroflexi bacterium]|nr:type II toxin-antitoxin system VapC family toxin [Chloroflexota bacterium]
MAEPIFLDVNVFMYAAGAPHPYKDIYVSILEDVENGVLTAATNSEVLQELLYRYSHIKLADKGIQLCRAVMQYPLAILPVTEADVRLAVDLFEAHRVNGLKPRDAIHAATMHNNHISQVISADRDFEHLDFVTRIEPLTYSSHR